jgi:hypothetical protein
VVGIDESIDALAETLEQAGVDPPAPPTDPPDWDAIAAAIEPMSLPADVRRWWERVDPWTMRAWAYPEPTRWDFALDTWIQHRDEFPGIAPRSLFLVGYTSWACMSVELDSALSPGGSLFEWRLEDGGFYLRYHDLAGWLERITSLVAAGEFERRDAPETGPRLLLEDPDAMLPMSRLPGPGTPNPVHGELSRYDRHPLTWPAHWRELSGIPPEVVKPRGASHTIGEVHARNPQHEFEATVRGRVTALSGSGSSWYARVADGTGTLRVTCPGGTTALGPVMGREFEFDLLVLGGEATATAIRPLDAP